MSEGMHAWSASSSLFGGNAAYIEELYEQYLTNPASVDAEWRSYFDALPKVNGIAGQDVNHTDIKDYFREQAKYKGPVVVAGSGDAVQQEKQVRVMQLISAHRHRGHQNARLDPLDLWDRAKVNELDPAYHGLTAADMEQSFQTGSFAGGSDSMKLKDIIASLQSTYCGSIGAEYMHIVDTDEKRWIQARLEPVQGRPSFDKALKTRILEGLTAAEGLEKYIGAKFPGAKRFSLEGGDAFVPMMDELVQHAGAQGVKEVVIGMAHRGRLNLLVNLLGKAPASLFDEFAGKHGHHHGSGDVKYHQGFSSDMKTPGGNVHLALAFNPSHLEIVAPVVIGSVRARQERRRDLSHDQVLPIIVHGDSAFTGQGCVMETFNFSQTRAYGTGGTLHIVINNQVGFTTSRQDDVRSTEYCTDIAKMVQAPIFHVNGDDPEAVIFVTQLACDFRKQFKKDVVIDLVCYRRHGHNEADEPNATQPVMYQKIKAHPTPRKLYADVLIKDGTLADAEANGLVDSYRGKLDEGKSVVKNWQPVATHEFSSDWTPYVAQDCSTVVTGVPVVRLQELGGKLAQMPEGLKLHARVSKIVADRQDMAAGKQSLDWGAAETLAYASLVTEGYGVRISGQDCGRGTFFHRHAVLHNQVDGSIYVPLKNLAEKQGAFVVIDSVLSEEAVLAFEYGYATAEPKSLVIWEAQFGDFANGAQVVIDQFISSGETKWNRFCGLALFLPHGYEGQGPEHSSARLERYLQLCAEHNMMVTTPTTPAQVFHMIRRQMLMAARKPLVVMTPKSLLRHRLAVSELADLAEGSFKLVIGETDALEASKVKRVVACGGKVYYDLLEKRRADKREDVAIVRVEQLYPFPEAELKAELAKYPNAGEFVWCQEEPKNQGAWYVIRHHLDDVVQERGHFHFAGRPASASPAVGYTSVHNEQQTQLVNDALG
ncbi:MAG: 2-oxoglutarate dehydrogenase E1 component [Gammaproteobacteria bacterium]|nr:2-oxoglutarate dehydrogenase E1 component [Gammaproteobacteria bacterium]